MNGTNVMRHDKSESSAPTVRYAGSGTRSFYIPLRSTGLDELCELVVSRHSRLRRLLRMPAPDIVIRNERRMLQAAVDEMLSNCGPVGFAIPDETQTSSVCIGCNDPAPLARIGRVGLVQDAARHSRAAQSVETGS